METIDTNRAHNNHGYSCFELAPKALIFGGGSSLSSANHWLGCYWTGMWLLILVRLAVKRHCLHRKVVFRKSQTDEDEACFWLFNVIISCRC